MRWAIFFQLLHNLFRRHSSAVSILINTPFIHLGMCTSGSTRSLAVARYERRKDARPGFSPIAVFWYLVLNHSKNAGPSRTTSSSRCSKSPDWSRIDVTLLHLSRHLSCLPHDSITLIFCHELQLLGSRGTAG
jgi:hypothetical protein